MSEFNFPLQALKGRGSSVRHPHRFERDARSPWDDGWGTWEQSLAGASASTQGHGDALRTEVRWEDARSAISRNDSPDIGFLQSINPYRGCEHGCSYCYARPSHAYLGLSPGLDFERILVARRGLAERLRDELLAPSYVPSTLVIGTVTDAYQPIERELRITRSLVEVLHAASHPWAIVTKSSGIERDLDLLAPMGRSGLAAVYVTITTLDAELARRLEPRAPTPSRRLRLIQTLAQAGVPVGVSVAPQIPFINEDMEQVLQAAAQAGANRAFYTVLRLPWEVEDVFTQWLQIHYPERASRVMARVRDLRGGKSYDSRYGVRMTGQGLWAELISQRFRKACDRLGLNRRRAALDLSRFRPAALRDQLDLF